MMRRTQILLDSALLRRARERAAQAGISLAEYIRRLLDRDLSAPRVVREPSVVFNLGDSAGADVAAEKDRMVAESMAASQSRKRGR